MNILTFEMTAVTEMCTKGFLRRICIAGTASAWAATGNSRELPSAGGSDDG